MEYFDRVSVELIYLLRFIVAGLCGLVVGIERTKRQKEAGLRTHFIVASASALMTCVSISFDSIGDGARIAAQIIPGVGFLCAGVIFFRRGLLHGLTTAAGVWATAGIGIAVGAGLYVLAICATSVLVIVQIYLHMHYLRRTTHYTLLIKFRYTDKIIAKIKDYFKINNFESFKVSDNGSEVIAEALVQTVICSEAEALAKLVFDNGPIKSIERIDE